MAMVTSRAFVVHITRCAKIFQVHSPDNQQKYRPRRYK